ncbi:MAG: sensor histidine kinase [Actinobacteria bacterium]|nr:sensor histidine kinase [Actinomycetota bacterium]
MLVTATGLIYVAAGTIAWLRRPSNRIGSIIVVGGFCWLIVGLESTVDESLSCLSMIAITTPFAVMIHLLHAFPSGRLRSKLSHRTVVSAYAVALVLQLPNFLFDPRMSPDGVLAICASPVLADFGEWIQRIGGITVMVITIVVMRARLRQATHEQRRVLAPLYLYGTAALLLVPLAPDMFMPLFGLSMVPVTTIQILVFAGLPVVFALAVLRGGFARTSEIQELGLWLGAAERPPLEQALAQTLGDESLRLVYWSNERKRYVDADGLRLDVPRIAAHRAAVEVEMAGRRVGAIVYDPTLNDDPELVRAAGRVVAIAVDHERLTAELRASRRALKISRERIVEAADSERRRIARDLHDGLQAELVALALNAQQIAGQRSAMPDVREAATKLRSGIDATASQLRQLVYAIMPAALIERGLSAAVEDLVDRMPIPTRLQQDRMPRRLPDRVERVAYFVIAEALANAVKHARATKLCVRLTLREDDLIIEVTDDGVGGALAGAGLGLRGIADRVDVVGGRLHVSSPAGDGTTVNVEIPCVLS